MKFHITCLFLALASISIGASAEVVRCTGPDGKVSYSDYKCPTATTIGNIKAVNTSNMQSPGETTSYAAPDAQQAGQTGRTRNINATINININVNGQPQSSFASRRVVIVRQQGHTQTAQTSQATQTTQAAPSHTSSTSSSRGAVSHGGGGHK